MAEVAPQNMEASMPSRLIRDGLIESEAVLSLPVEARWLYVTILLIADDVGLFEATEFHLARKSDLGRAVIGKLLTMLQDADLVRLYQGPGMRQLGFIPRFRQRLQIQRTKLPAPPLELIRDDEDAVRKFNDLAAKKAVDHGWPPKPTAAQRPEPEPEPELSAKAEKKELTLEQLLALDSWAKTDAMRVLRLEGVEDRFAKAWMATRKKLTPVAWNRVKREAQKAGMTLAQAVQFAAEKGWVGFEADWVVRSGGTSRASAGSTAGMNYTEGFGEDGRIL